MSRTAAADLRAALEFVAEAHSFESADEFRHGILPGLQRLVPSDLVGYNEVDPGGEAVVLTYPDSVPGPVNAELARLAHQHPLICVQMNGDNGTYKISDFLSTREFHSLELYEQIYSRIGAEDRRQILRVGRREIAGVDPVARDKMLYQNAADLYGF